MYGSGYGITIPPMVSALTKHVGWLGRDWAASAPGSAAWNGVQRAYYVPVILQAGCVVRRVWWANGATTTGGATIEVGVYANSDYGPGAKLISGSATQGTALQVQFVDVTDTALSPGLYWIAMLSSSSTNTNVLRLTGDSIGDAGAYFIESSLGSLPATATPAEALANFVPLCGFATTATP
jgi:hypothetical protein